MPLSSPKRMVWRLSKDLFQPILPHPITHRTWAACHSYLARRLLEGVFADPVSSKIGRKRIGHCKGIGYRLWYFCWFRNPANYVDVGPPPLVKIKNSSTFIVDTPAPNRPFPNANKMRLRQRNNGKTGKFDSMTAARGPREHDCQHLRFPPASICFKISMKLAELYCPSELIRLTWLVWLMRWPSWRLPGRGGSPSGSFKGGVSTSITSAWITQGTLEAEPWEPAAKECWNRDSFHDSCVASKKAGKYVRQVNGCGSRPKSKMKIKKEMRDTIGLSPTVSQYQRAKKMSLSSPQENLLVD